MTTPSPSPKKHTLAPWTSVADDHQRGRIYAGGQWLASTWAVTGEGNDAPRLPALDNAHRIVACVNAMAGIADPASLRKSHDELVKALKASRSGWSRAVQEGYLDNGGPGVPGSPDPGWPEWMEALCKQMDTALATAKQTQGEHK